MNTALKPHLRSMHQMLGEAETLALTANQLADAMRAEYARVAIADCFQRYDSARFTRSSCASDFRLSEITASSSDLPAIVLPERADVTELMPDLAPILIEAVQTINAISGDLGSDHAQGLPVAINAESNSFVLSLNPSQDDQQ